MSLKNFIFYLRAIACWLWIATGMAQNDAIGYITAAASATFLLALVLEKESQ